MWRLSAGYVGRVLCRGQGYFGVDQPAAELGVSVLEFSRLIDEVGTSGVFEATRPEEFRR